jgi:pyruvate dehydrogenase E2 component (dihydrolipoamide acetyltransferase)
VAALLYPEGAKDVPLGQIIAVLVEDKKDIAAFANYTASSASAPAKSKETMPEAKTEP